MKKILSLIFLILFFTLHSSAQASENFSTDYDVVYKLDEAENTRVTIGISLKNNTSQYYASSYSVQLGYKNISNIFVFDSGGELKYDLKKNENGTQVSFDFGNKVVGKDKIQKFSLSFDTKEISSHLGRIWEVNIPGISNQKEFSSFNVRVDVPPSFGKPVFIKPAPKEIKLNQNSLSFSKKDLGSSGISISYGSFQAYSLNLGYHLYNKNLFPVTSEIALPPDTNYQKIIINDISPKPQNVVKDKDGNWLASYRLLPSQKLNITLLGQAQVFLNPTSEKLTDEQRALYTKETKYWERDPKIINLAKNLKTPRAIFDYTVGLLSYDESRVKEDQVRAGAIEVLRNPKSAVCLEFTDLFIALSRAAGIPARQVDGFANTKNSAQRPLSLLKDVLHSWPQYYDFERKAWIMVDPTWENTTDGIDYFNTLDFDHLAFVLRGTSSTYPVPAGGYKLPGQENTQDVDVRSVVEFKNENALLKAEPDLSKDNIAGLPINGKLIIQNIGGVSSPDQTVEISSDKLKPSFQNLYIPSLPPYGIYTSSIRFDKTSFLTNEADTVKILVGKETIEKRVVVSPLYRNRFFLGGILIGSLTLFLSVLVRRSRRLHVS